MLLIVILMFGAIVGRLTQLQVLAADSYTESGESQRIRNIPLSADRGSIFDRNGRDLAISVPRQTIWADPREITDETKLAQVASALAPLLNKDFSELQNDIRGYMTGKKKFMYISRKVDDDVAQKIKDLKLPGIYAYSEPKRYIPNEGSIASLIGRVDPDNIGLSGLETLYDKQLSGNPGSLIAEQDINGRDIPGGLRKLTAASRGDDLVLTIDSDLQYKVQAALAHEINIANAKGGIAAVMDVKTGEVLSLVNLVVPKDGRSAPVEPASYNMALTNVYEPGSVSKLITISAALEAGIVDPSTVQEIPNEYKVATSMFHDAEPHPTMHWNTTDIFAASSNIGTIKIAEKLGKERLDKYQRAYGYGSTTGLKWPKESEGLILPTKKYSATTLATTSIGQGVSVTAMQMLAVFNTIANGGEYIAPKLVKSTIDSKGKEHPTDPSATRRVVSPETAAQMNLMMQEVVRVGTATQAQIDGYEVAGKTGTANKPRDDGPGYEIGAYVSSFAGFLPAAKPRFTAIVILDEPTPVIYGGYVAAPVFADISRYALQSYNVAPAPWGKDRHGVPFASSTATHVVGSLEKGTTAEEAEAAVIAAKEAQNKEESPTSSSPTSTTSSTIPRTTTTQRQAG